MTDLPARIDQTRHTISQNAIAVGLSGLIPLPFVDSWVKEVLMRGAVGSLADQVGAKIADRTVGLVAKERGSSVLGCVGTAIWYPIKKLFRTIVVVFMLKDFIDWTTEAALRGEMLLMALRRGLVDTRADAVAELMHRTLYRYRTSPVSRIALRMDRPDIEWGGGRAGRFVGWLVKHGGGGLVLPEFAHRLDELALAQTDLDVEAVLDAAKQAPPVDPPKHTLFEKDDAEIGARPAADDGSA